ncbi:MAG: phosphoribosylglycinamide formyltransferase [Acidimicrobiales bacterium]
MQLGVLASGTGTILESMLDAGLSVEVVVVDRACRATEVAERAGVSAELVERTSFDATFDRESYTKQVLTVLLDHGVDLVAIAGFGTVLSPSFFDAFPDRVLNTHPSLLPAFKGWHAVDEALKAGVKVTGTTVHIATSEVDAGPILAQEPVRVLPGDDVASLHERIKAVERRLYPDTIARFARGELP